MCWGLPDILASPDAGMRGESIVNFGHAIPLCPTCPQSAMPKKKCPQFMIVQNLWEADYSEQQTFSSRLDGAFLPFAKQTFAVLVGRERWTERDEWLVVQLCVCVSIS